MRAHARRRRRRRRAEPAVRPSPRSRGCCAAAAGRLDTLAFVVWRHIQTATAAVPLVPRVARGVVVDVLELDVAAPSSATEPSLDDEHGSVVVVAEWQPHPAPAVIVMHGVGGSSDDPYVMRAARALSRRG